MLEACNSPETLGRAGGYCQQALRLVQSKCLRFFWSTLGFGKLKIGLGDLSNSENGLNALNRN